MNKDERKSKEILTLRARLLREKEFIEEYGMGEDAHRKKLRRNLMQWFMINPEVPAAVRVQAAKLSAQMDGDFQEKGHQTGTFTIKWAEQGEVEDDQ